ncbi:hypothetical protein K431DRAFT_93535 [Polychaeton citri CBS 116435]|uniref:Uncharacterized protein n=1 Tax=Polychaeton citri CBS 116435 TaxID=1314669 RepID=A0A9P4UN75_9PEZI|nr:hypothetical protein K431DRAFT_93535 [Polychaeton citri CBS 116435]
MTWHETGPALWPLLSVPGPVPVPLSLVLLFSSSPLFLGAKVEQTNAHAFPLARPLPHTRANQPPRVGCVPHSSCKVPGLHRAAVSIGDRYCCCISTAAWIQLQHVLCRPALIYASEAVVETHAIASIHVRPGPQEPMYYPWLAFGSQHGLKTVSCGTTPSLGLPSLVHCLQTLAMCTCLYRLVISLFNAAAKRGRACVEPAFSRNQHPGTVQYPMIRPRWASFHRFTV